MLRLIYNTLIHLALPLLFVRLWFRGNRSPAYRLRWGERLGFFNPPSDSQQGICFHCVSVGEAIAATPLIKQIQQQYQHLPITITTTTPTGSDQVKATFGESVFHVYLPFDTPGAIKRFFHQTQPRLLVIIETELWPNLLRFARLSGVKTLLANARLSHKSAKGYKRIASLSRQMMDDITLIATQNQQDGDRFVALGLAQDKLAVTGSIKFDICIDEHIAQRSRQLKAQWGAERPIWVVGSTHQGEDELILQVYRQVLEVQPDLLLVLVPRHPERFDQVAQLIERSQLVSIRRSEALLATKESSNDTLDAQTQVILGDTMGELMLFWSVADIAFVGGSLVKHGGHNPLEPCTFNVPVISGPHVFNFKHIYQSLAEKQAVLITSDERQLTDSVIRLLQHPNEGQQQGRNASAVIAQNRGALERLHQQINQLL
ncbi:MAG: 3-deoxy-D-manno-octulosonic-acid transferase [Phenylobacterium sp.]|jgi:3-deoxy-D-manno-octulosonic-acid transferase